MSNSFHEDIETFRDKHDDMPSCHWRGCSPSGSNWPVHVIAEKLVLKHREDHIAVAGPIKGG